jgi:hypothetical protein
MWYNIGMKILAIESSCDETAAAVIEDGVKILSNVVVSQVDIFAKYGGDSRGGGEVAFGGDFAGRREGARGCGADEGGD